MASNEVVLVARSGVLYVIDPVSLLVKCPLQDVRLNKPTYIASGGPRLDEIYVADDVSEAVIDWNNNSRVQHRRRTRQADQAKWCSRPWMTSDMCSSSPDLLLRQRDRQVPEEGRHVAL